MRVSVSRTSVFSKINSANFIRIVRLGSIASVANTSLVRKIAPGCS